MDIEKTALKMQSARAGRTMKMDRAANELATAGQTKQRPSNVFPYPSGSKVAALVKLSMLIFKE